MELWARAVKHNKQRSRNVVFSAAILLEQYQFVTTTIPIKKSCQALTILEMLVSTALLSFIVLGLSAMLIETQNVFKSGIKQASVTDAGRTIVDMIASDLSQMSDPHFTNVYSAYAGSQNTGYYPPTNLFWQSIDSDLIQYTNNSSGVAQPFRTNQLEDVFAVVLTNNNWLGIGYSVSNWFVNGNTNFPGIGTLYRYVTSTTAPLTNNNLLYYSFQTSLGNNFTNFHRVADGVVHLKITAYDANGNEDPNQVLNPLGPLIYPTVVQTNNSPPPYQTNYLPHSIDIELGILEPEAFEHARALYTAGATVAASNYLATAVGQVEIFRQHIIIPAAP